MLLLNIFHVSAMSSNLCIQSQSVWVPGSPSLFLPKNPPRLAVICIASRNVGGFNGDIGFFVL